jgi:hypothetical protein
MLIDQRTQRIRSIRKTTGFRNPNNPVWRSFVTERKRNRARQNESPLSTYGSVVSHFVRHVLPASKTLGVDTDLDKERVNTSQEVSQSFVVNGSLRMQEVSLCLGNSIERPGHTYLGNSIADGHLAECGLSAFLDLLGKQVQDDVLDFGVTSVSLVLGIDIVLDLGHGKFPIVFQMRRSDD